VRRKKIKPMYATITNILEKLFKKSTIFKYGFNLSPMYRRSTGRVLSISDDFLEVKIKIPLNYKNRNFVGSLFGGSLYSAVDPFYMIQLMQILGKDYVVWDKAAAIRFRKPVRENAYVDFVLSVDEIIQIKKDVQANKEIDLLKNVAIKNKEGTIVFAEVSKTIYIADKQYYKNKRKKK